MATVQQLYLKSTSQFRDVLVHFLCKYLKPYLVSCPLSVYCYLQPEVQWQYSNVVSSELHLNHLIDMFSQKLSLRPTLLKLADGIG